MADSLNARGLGLALVARRKALGLGRPDLANMASLSYPYVAELEKGRKVPSQDALERLAAALEVAPAELVALGDRLGRDAADGGRPQALPSSHELINYATSAELSVENNSDDLVDRLTAEVMSRIGPIVRAAIAEAFGETR